MEEEETPPEETETETETEAAPDPIAALQAVASLAQRIEAATLERAELARELAELRERVRTPPIQRTRIEDIEHLLCSLIHAGFRPTSTREKLAFKRTFRNVEACKTREEEPADADAAIEHGDDEDSRRITSELTKEILLAISAASAARDNVDALIDGEAPPEEIAAAQTHAERTQKRADHLAASLELAFPSDA